VSVGAGLCDVFEPARDAVGAFDPWPLGATSVRSVTREGGLAAYAMNGSIYAAGVDDSGHFHTLGRQDADRVLVPGEAPFMASALADPELVSVAGGLRLFFTGVDASGVRSIGYLDYDATLAMRAAGSMPRRLIAPSQVAAQHVDGATYVETTSANPDGTPTVRRWIVFRAVVSSTRSELRAAELVGSDPVLGIAAETTDAFAGTMQFYTPMHPTSAMQALYVNRSDDATAFDHDEIASPEVVWWHGVLRVFFSARLGARWTIGMLRSPDFAHFERAYERPVLAGSGSGFDAVSVSDPAAWLDTGGTLALYYAGSDGTTMQPGLATQQVPVP
jgi:hypothetical protein